MNETSKLQQEIAHFIVESLKLDINPDEINGDTQLVGEEGLGLDSIDILELAFAISKTYGVSIKSGDSKNVEIFANLAALAKYIDENKSVS